MSLLPSLLTSGLRSTLFSLLSPSITKHPRSQPQSYVHIRQRDKKGRIKSSHVYRLIGTRDGDKVYRLVDWRERKRGAKEEIVLRKVGVWGLGDREFERGERREDVGGSTSRERGREYSRAEASRARRVLEREGLHSGEEEVHRVDGVKSPFRQPDMDVRRSHVFVFGDQGVDEVRGGELRGDSRLTGGDVDAATVIRSPGRREKRVRPGEVVVERKSVAVRAVAVGTP